MGKIDELRRSAMGNIDESMGAKRGPAVAPIHGVSAATPRGTPARLQGITRTNSAAEIPIAKIARDPSQPREEFEEDALRRLADSLGSRGQLQPIRVRWDEPSERYVVICGERRWRAAQMAGLATLSCVIVDGPLSPAELTAIQLIENMLREDLKPIEQAKGFKSLMEANGWSGHRLAQELGVAQPTVVRALSLLELPAGVQEKVEQGSLAPATAYELSKVEDPDARSELAEKVVAEGLSRAEAVEEVRKVVGRAQRGRAAVTPKGGRKTPRLPAEMKKRGSRGSRIVVQTTAKLTMADVIADLRELADRLEAELSADGQQAA
jgi:ParB family transcriptional regulator, chromosome partitioning protein